jgi:hypothetical protein
LFSAPDDTILRHTHGVLTVCGYQGDAGLTVIGVKSIVAVVGMVPFGEEVEGQNRRYFLAEKIGLDVYDPTESEDDNVE